MKLPFDKDRLGQILSYIDSLVFYVSLLGCLSILFYIGYNSSETSSQILRHLFVYIFYGFGIVLFIRTLGVLYFKTTRGVTIYSEAILFIFFFIVILFRLLSMRPESVGSYNEWLYLGIFGVFIIELSKRSLGVDKLLFSPNVLFVLSFLLLILLGTVLLILPKSYIGPGRLSFVDGLFMSTSAVCITGLSVVNISTQFTEFGQVVLITLVQVGGLGIMTFTGFFGYFFTGGFSYKNQLMYTELLGQNKVGFIIRTLYRIILFTFLLELLGALFIYLSVDASMFKSTDSRIFFAVFHSIAAFCNAGFSTLPDNLHSPEVRYNYNIQFIIAIIIILGGLGFGVLYNIWFYLKGKLAALISNTFYRETVAHKPWLLNLNTRLVLTMTAILVAGGTALLFLLEYNNLLAEHSSPWGKFVTAFFGAVTPRTAGFNNVDMASFSLPSIMLIMLLMWIGASPSSTGGGIRTTTFAVASLNILNLARESDRIELFKREISNETVRSAFAIVSLSLIVIGMASFGLTLSDGDKPLLALIFECISAFGTVGLTLGITTEMSSMGKLILTLTMFIGRVGPLTLILAMVVKAKTRHYHYPKEKLTLN